MESSKKITIKRSLIAFAIVIVASAAVFLLIPSNYYVHRALLHMMPKIDQYSIFENRIVVAGDPQPWDIADDAFDRKIPQQFETDFEKYETVAFLVIQHNRIIFEEFREDYSPLSASNSFSMSKSIISLLVGCAIDDGYIQSVNQPVGDFLPQWTSFDGKILTIKDLLTMSAGVEWDESHNSLFSKTTEAYYGKDLWKLALTEKLIEKPGVRFNYQSGVSQILAFLLQKATGKSVSEYASEKIWTPIHAEQDALWSLDHKDGMEKAYCCFNSNARDFARIGQLVLNKGRWGLVQVVDSNYVKEAITPATWLKFTPKSEPDQTTPPQTGPCTFYGYQFWLVDYKGLHIPYMRGILGQYVFIIPELDAIIVRLGKQRDKEYNHEQEYTKDLGVWLDAGIEIINQTTSGNGN